MKRLVLAAWVAAAAFATAGYAAAPTPQPTPKPGETKPGETKPGETKPGETKPGPGRQPAPFKPEVEPKAGDPAAKPGERPADAAKRAEALARVAAVPEIGKCKRELLGGQTALDALGSKKKAVVKPERADFDKAHAHFLEVANEYRTEVEQLLENAFKDRMKGVASRFDKQAAEIELGERQRREDAIQQFQRFIAKYPLEPRYTPDAMFRLAELYYEKSAVDYDDGLKHYNEQKALYDRGKVPEKPTVPERGYADSVKTYRALLKDFAGTYRYADAVAYLLGYVLEESGEFEEAKKVWLGMVERYPKSDYGPEVFLRIAESEFDGGEYEAAASYYQKALAYTESRYFDKALYKLAWTYFQMYDYDRAIKTFKQLIAWYDEHKSGSSSTASALRQEAIDYLAKSLAEDDWDNDGEDDKNAGIARALGYLSGGTPWERDIVARYAEALYDLHDLKKYGESIEVYRKLIAQNPLALATIDYQQKIIQIYDVLRDIDNATKERQKLAEMFSPTSPWAQANQAEARRIAEGSEAIEDEMRRRALSLHQRAQELKEEGKTDNKPELLAQALDNYKQAARAYREYLSRYSNEPEAYEMRFYLAESLYYSEHFQEAAAAYLEVASDPYQAKFRETAAWSSVKAYERILVDAVQSKKIPEKSVPGSNWQPPKDDVDQGGDPKKVTPEPIPEEVRNWLQATDFYVLRDITRQGSRKPQAAFAYQAASMTMRFKDYEDSRTRFRQVIACFPDDALAAEAMKSILNMYRDENDLENLERWATIADNVNLGDAELALEIKKTIKVFKLGAQFQRAESLLAAGRTLEAAKEFERIADQNPDFAALDKAYFNGAIAYKDSKYYDSAARIFDKLVNDPKFAKSEFKTDSIFQLAENYKLFFAFDKATDAYLAFMQVTDGSKNPNRPYALFTAARLQEYSGRIPVAAATYERYAETFKDSEEAANALFRAAELHEKNSDRDAQRRVLLTFIKRFKDSQGMSTRILAAMMQLGDIALAQGKLRDAAKQYEDVGREYQVRGFQPGTAASEAAAKAKFMIIDQKFADYAKIRLTGTVQQKMAADLKRKRKVLDELELAYAEVFPYKSLDWTIAAFFRLGDIYRDFADTLYKAPQPRGLTEEELQIFTNQVEDEGLKYENTAIERFEKTVTESRRLKVTNDWAKRALEAINKYKPQDYPLFKEPKRRPTFEPRFRVDARTVGAPTKATPTPTPTPTDANPGVP